MGIKNKGYFVSNGPHWHLTEPLSVFFWPRNTNLVQTAPLSVFSILGNSSSGPTRTQLEIRKDREISTWVSHVQKYLQLVN